MIFAANMNTKLAHGPITRAIFCTDTKDVDMLIVHFPKLKSKLISGSSRCSQF